MADQTLSQRILAFIEANPGTKNRAICNHLKAGPCDREVDRALQALRKTKQIKFRSGWYLNGAKP